MKIVQQASAGTTESSDILVTINQNQGKGLEIQLNSSVEKQFGRQIRDKISQTLDRLGVSEARVEAVDKGALDCTIEARTIAAVYRAAQKEEVEWEVIRTWNA